MLLWADTLKQLDFDCLMAVYWEGNRENALEKYPYMDPSYAHSRAEQDFLDYLRNDFFRQTGSRYCLWQVDGRYVSALRLEPWEDGLLLEALETHPKERRKGYALALIRAVQQALPGTVIYSHVNKRNKASLEVHRRCGFQIHKDFVHLLDGTVSTRGYTLRWKSMEGAV